MRQLMIDTTSKQNSRNHFQNLPPLIHRFLSYKSTKTPSHHKNTFCVRGGQVLPLICIGLTIAARGRDQLLTMTIRTTSQPANRRRCHALRAHSACLPACRLSAQIPLYWSHTQESLFQILSSLQKCLASSGSKVSWLLAYRTHSACHRLAPAKHDEYIRQQFSGFIKKTSKTKSILNLCIHRLHLR